jgi:hypothetical protein
MEKIEFKFRLAESTRALIDFTQSLVTNSISDNIEYMIEPKWEKSKKNLNKQEWAKLKELNRLGRRALAFEETVDVLNNSGRIPIWINSEVYLSSRTKTIILLTCSRRYRANNDLDLDEDEFPPFHPVVKLPPWREEGMRFNVNWQHQLLKREWFALTWKWRHKEEIKRESISNA